MERRALLWLCWADNVNDVYLCSGVAQDIARRLSVDPYLHAPPRGEISAIRAIWKQTSVCRISPVWQEGLEHESESKVTISYGGRRPDDFVALLNNMALEMVERLRPDLASMGIYTHAKSPEKGIQGMLTKGGIQYVSFLELGNVFRDTADWRQRYQRLMEQAGDVLFERLWAVPSPFCLMCAEQK